MKTKYNGIVKLSDEKFTILSTTGQLQLNDGSILTYDPISTLYITPKLYNQFTDADKQKVDVIKLDGTGEKYLADDGQYKEVIGGIETIIGSEEEPINLYSQLALNSLYILEGHIGTVDDAFQLDKAIIAYKYDINEVFLIGAKLNFFTNVVYFDIGYTTSVIIEDDGAISAYTNSIAPRSINGTLASEQIYAPIVSGAAGQVLKSLGANNAPVWSQLDIPEVSADGVTIVKNTDNVLEAVAIKNGAATLAYSDIYDAIANEWEV